DGCVARRSRVHDPLPPRALPSSKIRFAILLRIQMARAVRPAIAGGASSGRRAAALACAAAPARETIEPVRAPGVLVCLLAVPRSVGAAGDKPARTEMTLEQMEEARELYNAGGLAFREGRYVEAEAAFRRVYQLGRSPGVLLDLESAVEKQGRWSD